MKQKIEDQDPETFPRPLEKTGDRIWLYRNHNAGFPFGALEKYPELVRTFPLALTSALGGVLAALLQKKGEHVRKLALSLIIGGSLSNLWDRYTRGYVIDYFSVRLGPLKKVVFNLGDIFVFLGSGILLLWGMAGDFRKE